MWVPYLRTVFWVENGKLTRISWNLQGASHQIFHVLIAVGQVVFLLGLRKVMLRHYLPLQGLDTLQMSNDTSLSLWMEPCIAIWGGSQPSNETSVSLWIEPAFALELGNGV